MKSSKPQKIQNLKNIFNEIQLSWFDPDKQKEVPRKLGALSYHLNRFINNELEKIKNLKKLL